jgi:hypothetical protein
VCYKSLTDNRELFVTVGGCDVRCEIFSSEVPVEFRGFSLDLETMHWQKGPVSPKDINGGRSLEAVPSSSAPCSGEERGSGSGGGSDDVDSGGGGSGGGSGSGGGWLQNSSNNTNASSEEVFQPQPRLRFAAERYGRHLVVYGGHGTPDRLARVERLLKLNLVNLTWSKVKALNKPSSHPDVASSQLAGGLICSGITFSFMGVQPCPKFDFLVMDDPADSVRHPPAGGSDLGVGAAESEASDDDDDDDDDDDEGVPGSAEEDLVMVRIVENGVFRMIRLPRHVAVMLMQQEHLQQNGDEDEGEDESDYDDDYDGDNGDGGGDNGDGSGSSSASKGNTEPHIHNRP